MTVYYNEIDPFAAAWLRELIKAGHIAPGDVDEKDVRDVKPIELSGYTQCHFFAGVSVWSYALRRAGWPDHRSVWTGSCPCQPFSAAGKGGGFDDERHLWPYWFHLIEQCSPSVVFGEQVASKNADAWIDLVQADMEALGYAFGAVPFPSAGVGAPHIRDRTYWMADANLAGLERRQRAAERAAEFAVGAGSMAGGLAEPDSWECDRKPDGEGCYCDWTKAGWIESDSQPKRSWAAGRLADADCAGPLARQRDDQGARYGYSAAATRHHDRHEPAGPTNGFWRNADWLFCRDGKWRPVEPGTSPLAHGAPARVGRLRGYGNAINAEAAVAFIEAALESRR